MRKEIMVKVCSECGIVSSESAAECESCGAELGAPVRSREANRLHKQIVRRNEKRRKAIADEKFGVPPEKPADIPVTPARKVIGIIGCLTAVCQAAVMVLCIRRMPDFTYEMVSIGIGTLILLAIVVLHCFLPGVMWSISHCFDWIYYKETPAPSDTALVLQIVSCVFFILLGIASITLQLLLLFGIL